MAITQSVNLQNILANPSVPNQRSSLGAAGNLAFEADTLPDTANSDNHILGICLPVHARVTSILLANAAGGTSASAQIGTFKRNATGAFVLVDADALSGTIDIASASAPREVLSTAGMGIKLHTASGEASPTTTHYYLGITTPAGTTSTTAFKIRVEYILD